MAVTALSVLSAYLAGVVLVRPSGDLLGRVEVQSALLGSTLWKGVVVEIPGLGSIP